jgi:hypothetical protein
MERLSAGLPAKTVVVTPLSLARCANTFASVCSRPALVGALGLAMAGRAA